MLQTPSGFIVAALVAFLAVGAIKFSNTVAMDGAAALDRKYAGRCLALSDGRRAEITSVRSKSIYVNVQDVDGSAGSMTIERIPGIDKYMVPCA